MSKANKDGWIRHRGGKFPESAKGFDEIEVRFRNGDVDSSDSWPRWTHNCGGLDIMAWRGHDLSTTEDICAVVDAAYKPAIAHADLRERYDGPIKWRDRITEIDSTTQALTTERAELVQKLASDGFALIGRINDLLTEAAQNHEYMSNPKFWRDGDMVEILSSTNCAWKRWKGMTGRVEIEEDNMAPKIVFGCGEYWRANKNCTFRWHSRPSA